MDGEPEPEDLPWGVQLSLEGTGPPPGRTKREGGTGRAARKSGTGWVILRRSRSALERRFSLWRRLWEKFEV